MTKAINKVVREYSTLDYPCKLVSALNNLLPLARFESLSKPELHCLLNQEVLKHYRGEEMLKFKLYKQYINKPKIIAAFEIKVNSSRADFLTINGHTTSYEIKSELDNLDKLSKQIQDYTSVFEFNNLVVDASHLTKALELVPETYGVLCFRKNKYQTIRKPSLNPSINPATQLTNLSKKELVETFPEEKGDKFSILNRYNATAINSHFKRTLKRRYASRWGFLTANAENILPLDVQFFFNMNVCPQTIYAR